MIESMTGFGRGTARVGQAEATVEIRSVNGRYGDVSVRLPRALHPHESAVQNALKDRLDRGKINAAITVQQDAGDVALVVDARRAAAYGRLLREAAEAAGLPDPTAADLFRFSDVLVPVEGAAAEDDGDAWAATQAALNEATDRLLAMRRTEGEALAADFRLRLDLIEEELAGVEAQAPERTAGHQARLRERLDEIAGDDRINPERLEAEVALLADKLDVTEECVRLRAHLAAFRAAMESDEAVGRRLNFLAQEFNREINTIASKANDAGMAARAVRMKEELEKIREQVQNVV
jgi:uncharacterized protein (TIGR00255 family)